MAQALRIGMFGGGVVGGGVYEILTSRKQAAFAAMGIDATVVKICVRDLAKPRTFQVEPHTQLVTDYDAILKDDSINCIIELMGGVTHAKDVVFEALKRGKHVITANKALLATYLPEIEALLAAAPQARLGYEAAVCGGIPIIAALQQDYVGDSITKVVGIMNGTTNFMLTKMEQEGADYAAVLKEAQDLGFAEADPTADVEGHDVQAKIALLAKLAFGQTVPLSSVPCAGISALTAADFAFAKSINCTIKLLGTAATASSDPAAPLTVYVSPALAPLDSPFAAARGPGNVVVVSSENLTESQYAGPGAGRYPTANSVVSDVARLARGTCAAAPFPPPPRAPRALAADFAARFYVRTRGGGGAALAAAAKAAGVTIAQTCGGSGGVCQAVTALCRRSAAAAMCSILAGSGAAAGAPLCLPLV